MKQQFYVELKITTHRSVYIITFNCISNSNSYVDSQCTSDG